MLSVSGKRSEHYCRPETRMHTSCPVMAYVAQVDVCYCTGPVLNITQYSSVCELIVLLVYFCLTAFSKTCLPKHGNSISSASVHFSSASLVLKADKLRGLLPQIQRVYSAPLCILNDEKFCCDLSVSMKFWLIARSHSTLLFMWISVHLILARPLPRCLRDPRCCVLLCCLVLRCVVLCRLELLRIHILIWYTQTAFIMTQRATLSWLCWKCVV